MTPPKFDVLGIGNAIVDIISRTDDQFLIAEGLQKGTMALMDEQQAEQLAARIKADKVVSGGSAANTIVGVSSLGLSAAFIGIVKNDSAGIDFMRDLQATGVHFQNVPTGTGPSTARCYVMVTPDGERTMSTYLGACQHLTPGDIDPELIGQAAVVYLEGYLWDPEAAKEAFRKAADLAHTAGNKVALTLSDPFCVHRYRQEFLDLIRTGVVDIVFANQHELMALYQTDDIDQALSALKQEKILAAVTRSEKGSVVIDHGVVVECAAHPIEQLVDTTGAGDLYAAGFLAGLSRQLDHRLCAALGALAAAEVIQHYGARPEQDLVKLALKNGFVF